MFQRASIILPAIIGASIGWLGAAVIFLAGHRDGLVAVAVGLSSLYFVLAWETRWWLELRKRLPFAIYGGGILTAMFCPAVARRLDYSQMDIVWILSPRGPLNEVVWALAGALLFVLVMAALSPLSDSNEK